MLKVQGEKVEIEIMLHILHKLNGSRVECSKLCLSVLSETTKHSNPTDNGWISIPALKNFIGNLYRTKNCKSLLDRSILQIKKKKQKIEYLQQNPFHTRTKELPPPLYDCE